MVYESGFTTRRTYSTRPVVSSYSVTYPVVTKVARVYKTSYPIYSTTSYTRGSRVIASPVRIVTSPARVYTRVVRSPSPVRVVRTTRVITTPDRYSSSYTYTSPTTYSYVSPYTPTTYVSSYVPSTYVSSYTPTSYVYTTSTNTPSYYYTPISRLYTRSVTPVRVTTSSSLMTPSYLKRNLPIFGSRSISSYLGTEPYTVFQDEANRIRYKAQSLARDVHTPVTRYSRSTTPFPVIGYEPASKLALDAYVSRITNPVRHVAKEVHKMSMYAEPARKYVGKSHLASVRICGNRSYDLRRPMFDSDRLRNDINLLSWYLRHPTVKSEKKLDVDEKVESVDTVCAAEVEA